MARTDLQTSSLAAGELSPLALGRIDVARYAHAARSMTNYLIGPTGAILHRPGTQYRGGSRTNLKALLIPFVANTTNEFVIEITGATGGPATSGLRVWYGPSRTLVYDNAGTWNITQTGSVAFLTVPWLPADLFDVNGVPLITAVQSNDVMWLTHPSYMPQKLTRIAAYKFAIAPMSDGVNPSMPFRDINPTETVTMQASAATGAGITITAGSATFTAADVGGWLLLERPKNDSTKPWATGVAATINNLYRANGRYYNAGSSANMGTERPTHSVGIRNDGLIDFEYYDDGYGVAAITGFTDSTHVTATVVKRLPNTVVAGTTTRWARGAWNAAEGYPSSIAFYRERLCFARDQTIWTSVAGDFENFQQTEGGVQTPDMAITVRIASDKNDRIKWLAASPSDMLCGSASNEWAVGPQSDAEVFSAVNVRALPVSGYGCHPTQPARVAQSLLYVERGGRRVREAKFDIQIDNFSSRDLNIYADHIFSHGTCCQLAHQRVPFGIVWGITNGGQLKGFTFQDEQEVWAWHPHVLGGTGLGTNLKPAVRSIASIASPDGVNDDLWLCVERRINGVTTYYIEVLGPHPSYTLLGYVNVDDLTDVRDSQFLDCAVQSPLIGGATTITGLSHLNGESAVAVVNGELRPLAPVSGGTMTIPATDEACKAWTGFYQDADVIPVSPVGNSGNGSSQAKRSVISHIGVRVKDSLNFRFGRTDGALLQRAEFRRVGAAMSAATPLRSGDFVLPYGGGSTDDTERPEYLIRQDQPFPLIILGLFPRLTTED